MNDPMRGIIKITKKLIFSKCSLALPSFFFRFTNRNYGHLFYLLPPDGDDEMSAIIRSAEKRNQKVRDLLQRMQSSDEEDLLCEPVTQHMAPLHVRLK